MLCFMLSMVIIYLIALAVGKEQAYNELHDKYLYLQLKNSERKDLLEGINK